MAKKRTARLVAGFILVLGAGSVVPTAHAAPECRGVIQCLDDRVRECIQNLTLPPGRC